MIYQSICNRNS